MPSSPQQRLVVLFENVKRIGITNEPSVKYRVKAVVWFLVVTYFNIFGPIMNIVHNSHNVRAIFASLCTLITMAMSFTIIWLTYKNYSFYTNYLANIHFDNPCIGAKVDALNDLLNTVFQYLSVVFPYFSLFLVCTIMAFSDCDAHVTSNCGLFFDADYCYDIYYVPMRQIYMVLQVYTSMIGFLACVNGYMFVLAIIDFGSIYVINLKWELQRIREFDDFDSQIVQFMHCLDIHKEFLELFDDIRSHILTGVYYLGTSCVIAIPLLICKLLIEPDAFSVLLAITYIGGYVLTANSMQLVLDQLEFLHLTIFYSIPWNGNIELQKRMLMMMMRNMLKPKFDFGVFGLFNRNLLAKVFRFIYTLIMSIRRYTS